jgi:TetR/AcrR family transcriptional regulator, transcriptional repressor for nem operon
MKKAGLSKGGFYRHFGSKDDLFVEAVARAFDEMGRGMLEVAKSAPEGQGLRAIIERYLSTRHANSPGMGCVLAALGPEFARKPLSVRKRIEAAQEAYRERLLPFVPGQTREEKLAKFQLLFPSMAGVLTAARVKSCPQERERVLTEARNFFIKSFSERCREFFWPNRVRPYSFNDDITGRHSKNRMNDQPKEPNQTESRLTYEIHDPSSHCSASGSVHCAITARGRPRRAQRSYT